MSKVILNNVYYVKCSEFGYMDIIMNLQVGDFMLLKVQEESYYVLLSSRVAINYLQGTQFTMELIDL